MTLRPLWQITINLTVKRFEAAPPIPPEIQETLKSGGANIVKFTTGSSRGASAGFPGLDIVVEDHAIDVVTDLGLVFELHRLTEAAFSRSTTTPARSKRSAPGSRPVSHPARTVPVTVTTVTRRSRTWPRPGNHLPPSRASRS